MWTLTNKMIQYSEKIFTGVNFHAFCWQVQVSNHKFKTSEDTSLILYRTMLADPNWCNSEFFTSQMCAQGTES